MTDASKRPRLRVGVAGLGFGAAVHVPALRSVDGVDVVAIMGTDWTRTADMARRLNIDTACTGIDALLDVPLDMVTLALPPQANEDAAAKTIRRGLPVLCEKPLASTAKAAESLATLGAGHVTAVDFEFAELTTFRAMRDLIARGELGDVRSVDVAWQVDSWAHRSKSWSWKCDAAAGGGVMALLGSHVLHLVESIFGRITALTATADAAATSAYAPTGASAAPDTVHLQARLTSEASLSVRLSNVATGRQEHRWHVRGDHATLTAANDGSDWVAGFNLYRDDTSPRELVASEPRSHTDGRISAVTSVLARFVGAVRAGRSASPDFAAGARVQKLMESIDRAASDRSWISVT